MTALNFDPYAALAEIENGRGLRANWANGANPTPTLALLAPLALSPAQEPKSDGAEIVAADPAAWAAALAGLDASQPPPGFDPDRWKYVLADARWICTYHGRAAHALGWTASDLFGIGAAPGWGGLADRLEGARTLVLTNRIAHWRGADLEGWLWRETMRPMPPIWAWV